MIKVEKIQNQFKASPIPTKVMHRVIYGFSRFYANMNPYQMYSGLTGALGAVKFRGNMEAKRIDKWRDKMVNHLGFEGQKAYLNSMADFGTLVHTAAVRAWEQGFLDWAIEKDLAEEFFQQSAIKNNIIPSADIIHQQTFEYCKSAASVLQFLHDSVVELYAVETMGLMGVYQIATPVDLVCKLKDGRTVTLNIKTSEQIGAGHREQVAVELAMWNETYSDVCPADATGILRPKAWRNDKIPTYEIVYLKDEEADFLSIMAFNRLELAMKSPDDTYLTMPDSVLQFDGVTKLGEQPTIRRVPMEEVVNERIEKTKNL